MKIIKFILAVIFVSFQAVAEDEWAESTQETESKPIKQKAQQKGEDEWVESGRVGRRLGPRADKIVTAAYQVVGLGPSSTFSKGFHLGFFINPDWVVMLEATNGKETSLFDVFDDTEVESLSYGLHVKNYVGRSFYYRFGVDYREIEYGYVGFFLVDTVRTFESKSWAVNLSIGNQWQFSNFTLGCDWVGVSMPVSKKYSNEFVSTTGSLAAEQQANEDAKEDLTEKPQINLLRFYLGVSF